MELALFLLVLLGCIAIGMPIAFALLMTGIALMLQMDMLDSQLVTENLVSGANNFPSWPSRSSSSLAS